jgi:hypothetical protein
VSSEDGSEDFGVESLLYTTLEIENIYGVKLAVLAGFFLSGKRTDEKRLEMDTYESLQRAC